MPGTPAAAATNNPLSKTIQLIRPVNGALTLLCIASMGFIAQTGMRQIDRLLFAGVTGFLLASFGNVLNDIIDIPIDRINKPGRALPSGAVSVTAATALAALTLTGGMAIAAFLGPVEFMAAGFVAALLAAYNMWLKRIPLLGNAIVGGLTSAAFVYGGLVLNRVEAALFPALFAFLINMIREIIKDIEDIEGDAALGLATFPQKVGVQTALRLATGLSIALAAVSIIPFAVGMYSRLYLVLVVLLVDLPVCAACLWIIRRPTKKNISKMSIFLKLEMIIGLLTIMEGVL